MSRISSQVEDLVLGLDLLHVQPVVVRIKEVVAVELLVNLTSHSTTGNRVVRKMTVWSRKKLELGKPKMCCPL